ncbi:ABC transporter permease [Streptomyces albidus (ex Kaewkla and Franco 2022)]|uniref:ABC transporter permease n=1 Tax=Streptomyces albidus (ex Kaewkla and Franco 2022) TaxID=722709 RepID=UPI0015EE5B41|nr:ABC transporter permease [Streptomyces albidus (ex Kaewkla and Franco 2022)]
MTTPGGTPVAAPAAAGDTEGVGIAALDAGRTHRMPGWFVILWRNGKCRLGLLLLAAFVLVAVLAPYIAPFGPRVDAFATSQGPTGAHWLGTTAQGEDVYSQIVYGARTSLLVGVVAGTLSTLIAMAVGLTAGYLQGFVDEVLSFFVNLGLVVPVLPLMITLAAYAPVKGLGLIIVVITVTGWAHGARIKRAQIITLRTRDYVTAAKFAGDSTARIITHEIAPNMMSLIVVGFMSSALGAIGAEAGLAFLGLGDPQTTSWGTMLNQASLGGAMTTGQWAWVVAPGLILALLVTSFTLINFGVDALSNPHLRED